MQNHIYFSVFFFFAKKFNTKCNSRFVFAALVCFVTNLLGSTFAAFAVGSGLEKCLLYCHSVTVLQWRLAKKEIDKLVLTLLE